MPDKPTVASRSQRFQELESMRELCHDLMGGTKAMIVAREKWLPRHPAESEGNYDLRINQNTLTNFLEQAVKKASGKIFSQPIKFKESVPKEIVDICKNLDRKGSCFSAFMLDRVKNAFIDGISYILIDMPRTDGVVTRADEKNLGIRPYTIAVNATNLLEVVSEMIDNVQVITRIRVRETVQEKDGDWGYNEIAQIRVLERVVLDTGKPIVTFKIFRENDKSEWVERDSGFTTMEEIPLVPIYTNRVGFMEGEPVFQATAELNLEHWRSKGEQLLSLSFGRFAMLAGSGVDDEKVVEVGPSKKLMSTDPNSKFYYVETNGAGLEQGWKHLATIEKSIETASATLRMETQGRVTATAASIESEETNPTLKTIVQGIQDNVEFMFEMFARLLGLGAGKGGEVEFNTDFGTKKGSEVGMQEINRLAISGHISNKSAIRNLIWRGELEPDFDIEKNDTELKEEMASIMPTAKDVIDAMNKAKKANMPIDKGSMTDKGSMMDKGMSE